VVDELGKPLVEKTALWMVSQMAVSMVSEKDSTKVSIVVAKWELLLG
jgi:hypothetical protein